MLSGIRTYGRYRRIMLLEELVAYLPHVIVLLSIRNMQYLQAHYGEILLFTALFWPSFLVYYMIPHLYDLYISERREVIFFSEKKIRRFLLIQLMEYFVVTGIVFALLRNQVYRCTDVRISWAYYGREILLMLFLLGCGISILRIGKNRVAVYGCILLYLIISAILLSTGGIYFFKGYIAGMEINNTAKDFWFAQGWKIVVSLGFKIRSRTPARHLWLRYKKY